MITFDKPNLSVTQTPSEVGQVDNASRKTSEDFMPAKIMAEADEVFWNSLDKLKLPAPKISFDLIDKKTLVVAGSPGSEMLAALIEMFDKQRQLEHTDRLQATDAEVKVLKDKAEDIRKTAEENLTKAKWSYGVQIAVSAACLIASGYSLYKLGSATTAPLSVLSDADATKAARTAAKETLKVVSSRASLWGSVTQATEQISSSTGQLIGAHIKHDEQMLESRNAEKDAKLKQIETQKQIAQDLIKSFADTIAALLRAQTSVADGTNQTRAKIVC